MRWLLIDKIIACDPGKTAVGHKTFPRSDMIFMDHFPGFPIVPGVLQIEMIAQMAGKCIAMSVPGVLPVLGTVKSAKFYRNINPGDLCVIQTRILRIAKSFAIADGEILVDGQKASTAHILFGQVNRTNLNSNEFDAVTQDFLKKQQDQDNKEFSV